VYDSRTERHHHLRCLRCGAVSDLEADIDVGAAARAAAGQGFAPERVEVTVAGLCPDCAADPAA
jgi:Fe2+ or Zn2+ uptake regulation protein